MGTSRWRRHDYFGEFVFFLSNPVTYMLRFATTNLVLRQDHRHPPKFATDTEAEPEHLQHGNSKFSS
jgi:hypothetical protein